MKYKEAFAWDKLVIVRHKIATVRYTVKSHFWYKVELVRCKITVMKNKIALVRCKVTNTFWGANGPPHLTDVNIKEDQKTSN